ncbi:MAG: Tim44-like domain-containing protein [Burkholderiaceae bacterium]
MSRFIRLFVLMLATITTLVLVAPDAEARRMGGGKSFGKSSGSLFNRTPAQKPTQGASSGAPNGAAAAAGGARRGGMMGPIAGLAAGLGIAALASALGFGEELANLITIALLVVGGLFLVRFLMSRFGPKAPASGGLQPAGAGARAPALNRDMGQPAAGGAPMAAMGGGAATAATIDAGPDVPAGFDVDGFLRQAKVQFVRLQAVYDAGDLKDLREFTTPEMFAELKLEIGERGDTPNQTDVVTLNADLVGVTSQPDEHVAAVRFHGMIRESEGAAAEPFDEIWTLTKPLAGGGWTLAGIEQA